MYATLAGIKPYEGAVVTRGPSVKFPVQRLSSSDPDGWYLVQTNSDRWLPDPKDDQRRTQAEQAIRSLGRASAAQYDGMLRVMSVWYVLNPDTVFTAVLSPLHGNATFIGQNVHGPSNAWLSVGRG